MNGTHTHRSSGRLVTSLDGAHTHVFYLPDGRKVTTEPGGEHAHVRREDGTVTGGAHSHYVRVGDQILKTQIDGHHVHGIDGPRVTGDGFHTHILVLPDGTVVFSDAGGMRSSPTKKGRRTVEDMRSIEKAARSLLATAQGLLHAPAETRHETATAPKDEEARRRRKPRPPGRAIVAGDPSPSPKRNVTRKRNQRPTSSFWSQDDASPSSLAEGLMNARENGSNRRNGRRVTRQGW